MQKINLLLSVLLFWALLAQSQSIQIDSDLKSYGAIPTERQLQWQEMDMYCLIHFTPTTFQNKEWGYGDAPANLFNPSNFDADQIANAAKSAGFKGLISVAKHHDGFCLWPTKTTDYSIAHSPWKNGKGDMVEEFRKAAQKNGLKFGVYLSAWDRNDPRYGTAAYAEAYREQLRELMQNYGTLFTSWHDGANGGDGYYGGLKEKRTIDRATYYEWKTKTWPIVRQFQPMAVIFSDIGPDVRWVGNEKGSAGETSWSTFTPVGIDGQEAMPGLVQEKNLTSGDRNSPYWIPAECDVPLRKGWFYHPEQDTQVKTPEELFSIYVQTVGRGAVLNLGLAPTMEGQLHPNDVESLHAFGTLIQQTFKQNLAQNAVFTASNIRKGMGLTSLNNLVDSNRYSYWATDDSVHKAILTVDLQELKTFDLIQFRENIKLGQRIDSVWIDVKNTASDSWQALVKATSIGANRLIQLENPVLAQDVRVRLYAPVSITLSDFGLYKQASPILSKAASNTVKKPLVAAKLLHAND